MMKRLLAVSTLLSMFVADGMGQAPRVNQWKVVGPGGGGTMIGPTISPRDSHLVVERHMLLDYTDVGLFQSHDGGSSWRSSTVGIPELWRNTTCWLAFDPTAKGSSPWTSARTERCRSVGTSMSTMSRSTHGFQERWLGAAHVQFEIALIDRPCTRRSQAEATLKKLAASKEAGDVVWADEAARMQPGYAAASWRAQLTAGLEGARTRAQLSSLAAYNVLLLEQALGNEAKAKEAYGCVFLLSDQKLSTTWPARPSQA